MATHYNRRPTLEERVRAAKLIVTARVQSVVSMPQARIADVDEEQAIAHVVIDTVLQGQVEAREIDVRFVRGRGNDAERDNAAFAEGQRVLLMLVEDVGKDREPVVHVAYLRGAFRLTTNDGFTMETDADSEGGARTVHLTVNAVREAARKLAAEGGLRLESWAKLEPELARRPDLPAVTELPNAVEHGMGPIAAEPTAAVTQRPEPAKSTPRRARKR